MSCIILNAWATHVPMLISVSPHVICLKELKSTPPATNRVNQRLKIIWKLALSAKRKTWHTLTFRCCAAAEMKCSASCMKHLPSNASGQLWTNNFLQRGQVKFYMCGNDFYWLLVCFTFVPFYCLTLADFFRYILITFSALFILIVFFLFCRSYLEKAYMYRRKRSVLLMFFV